MLESLPLAERQRFVKLLATVASAGEAWASNGHAAPRGKVRRKRV